MGLGFHISISPGEFLDFLLGWTTLDFAHDDMSSDEAPKMQEEGKGCRSKTELKRQQHEKFYDSRYFQKLPEGGYDIIVPQGLVPDEKTAIQC